MFTDSISSICESLKGNAVFYAKGSRGHFPSKASRPVGVSFTELSDVAQEWQPTISPPIVLPGVSKINAQD